MYISTRSTHMPVPISLGRHQYPRKGTCTIIKLPVEVVLHILSLAQKRCGLLLTTRKFSHIRHNPQFLCLFRSPISRSPLQLLIEHLIERPLQETQIPGIAWRDLHRVLFHLHREIDTDAPIKTHSHTIKLCRRPSLPAVATCPISQLDTDCMLNIMSFLDARGNAILQIVCNKLLRTSLKSHLWKNLCQIEQNQYAQRARSVFQPLARRLMLSSTLNPESRNEAWDELYKLRLVYGRHLTSITDLQERDVAPRVHPLRTRLKRMAQAVTRSIFSRTRHP